MAALRYWSARGVLYSMSPTGRGPKYNLNVVLGVDKKLTIPIKTLKKQYVRKSLNFS